MRRAGLAALALAVSACGQAPSRLVTNLNNAGVDPAPEVSSAPTATTCPDGTTKGWSYADAPKEFCLEDAPSGGTGVYYVAAETQCETRGRKMCDLQELLGASRDGHLAPGLSLWSYSAAYDPAVKSDQYTGVVNSTTGAYASAHIGELHVYRNYYCCEDAR